MGIAIKKPAGLPLSLPQKVLLAWLARTRHLGHALRWPALLFACGSMSRVPRGPASCRAWVFLTILMTVGIPPPRGPDAALAKLLGLVRPPQRNEVDGEETKRRFAFWLGGEAGASGVSDLRRLVQPGQVVINPGPAGCRASAARQASHPRFLDASPTGGYKPNKLPGPWRRARLIASRQRSSRATRAPSAPPPKPLVRSRSRRSRPFKITEAACRGRLAGSPANGPSRRGEFAFAQAQQQLESHQPCGLARGTQFSHRTAGLRSCTPGCWPVDALSVEAGLPAG